MVMEIIKVYANQELKLKEPSIACIGFFDGVHLGHQKLVEQTLFYAKKEQLLPACVTFHEDPWIVLNKMEDIQNITPVEVRLKKLAHYGIERCYLLHFDKAMANLSKVEFVALMKRLNIQMVITGEDFRFAQKNSGDSTYLAEHIPTVICETLRIDGEKVSSSRIERAIETGDMELVRRCLGEDYAVEGSVVYGRQVGRKLGYPTANLAVEGNYIIPHGGVYAGHVELADQKVYKAMINIGHNPTLNVREDISIEAHILDFDEDIYGQNIKVSFHCYLRDEQKFNSKEALIEQLSKDIEDVRRLADET